jgi:hypothetical protein
MNPSGSCVGQFSDTIVKDLKKSIKRRKDLLWLMVSKVSVHGQLTGSLALFPGLGRRHGRRKLFTSWQSGPESRRKGLGTKQTLQGHTPMYIAPLTRSQSLVSTTSQLCHQIMNPSMGQFID